VQVRVPLSLTIRESGNMEHLPSEHEWMVLAHLVHFLAPFRYVTDELQGQKYSSLGLVGFFYTQLVSALQATGPHVDTFANWPSAAEGRLWTDLPHEIQVCGASDTVLLDRSVSVLCFVFCLWCRSSDLTCCNNFSPGGSKLARTP
jgi:hypothetical protein